LIDDRHPILDRHRGLAVLMPVRDPVGEVPKLRVAIRMRRPFARFPIGLQPACPSRTIPSGRLDPSAMKLPSGHPQVADAGMNGRARQAGRARHQADAAIADRAGLRRRPLPASPLIQCRRDHLVRAPNPRDRQGVSHAPVMTESRRKYKYYLYELFLREP
jgi:hypothetical protein